MADPLSPLLELSGVAAAIAATRTAVDALGSIRVVRRRSIEVTTESSLRGAWASARLSGVDVELDEVRAGKGDDTVQGILRVYEQLGPLSDTWSHAPRQVLARLHALAARDLVDEAELGRPAAGAADRLDTLAQVLAATSVPATVVAAIVQGELLDLDAFPPVSGIVARAAVRLVLIDRGLDLKSLVVVEEGHRQLALDYQDSVGAYRTGHPEGVAAWIRHCADAIVAGSLETRAICDALEGG